LGLKGTASLAVKKEVVAQGQIVPAHGLIGVMAPPGDRIESIAVTEGDLVEVGDQLVELSSLAVREAELQAALARRREATAQASITKSTAAARLKGAEISLQSAKMREEQGKLSDLRIQQADRELVEAKRLLEQLQRASTDPDVQILIGTATLNRQALSVQSAEQQRKLASQEADAAKRLATLSITAAEQEVFAAKESLMAAEDPAHLAGIDEQIRIIELQKRMALITSPIAGRVVSIDGSVGQTTGPQPILQLADTDEMVCRAEVDVNDLDRIRVGNSATIRSSALPRDLTGAVSSISQVVGIPRLPNPNPMSRSDFRSAIVDIRLDPAASAEAAKWLNLQVFVQIATSREAL
jgi:HlyD family secretion protein